MTAYLVSAAISWNSLAYNCLLFHVYFDIHALYIYTRKD